MDQRRGIGENTATAMTALIGNGRDFTCGRQFAAWLGLVPSHYSSGGTTRLGRITKAGDEYLSHARGHAGRRHGDAPFGQQIRAGRQGCLRHRRLEGSAVVASSTEPDLCGLPRRVSASMTRRQIATAPPFNDPVA
jgi:transposase